MKKSVRFDHNALKEMNKMHIEAIKELKAIVNILEEHGELHEPLGKKMSGHKNLYEIRVRKNGQFRGFYAYLINDIVIILHIFQKKSQKTPLRGIDTALKRLKNYE